MKSTLLSAILVLCASFAQAAVFDVDIGKGGLTFTPNNVTAAVGDTVVFTFTGVR